MNNEVDPYAELPASERFRFDVGPACHRPTMRNLRGIELRYVLTWQLSLHGPATLTELVDVLGYHGFCVAGPAPPKSVSDALRWERRRGRVRRLGRALYGPGHIPRGTEHRIHQRVLALRDDAIRSEVGTSPHGLQLRPFLDRFG